MGLVPLARALGDDHRWSRNELVALARIGDVVDIDAGDPIHPEGRAFAWAYLVITGTAFERCDEYDIAGGPGTFFGAGTCDGDRRLALWALTDVRVLVIGRRELLGLYERHPSFANRAGARLELERDGRATALPKTGRPLTDSADEDDRTTRRAYHRTSRTRTGSLR